ncbi:MFS4B-like protein [Mya arenaria]|uniref:MFS4B-like protein n=1 Tax=Mya arenaria TaxID=6604 RepID=A0ABY7D8X8_MYAAR|nr:MFS4B-like protein [Mya arenaria]
MTQTESDRDVQGNAIDEAENVVAGAVDTDSFLPVPETELKDVLSIVLDDEAAVDYKKLGLCHRLRVDHPFRRRFIHSFWLFWSLFGLGWMVGLVGPSFSDLRQIVKQDLDSGSWLFTTASIGYLLGSILGGANADMVSIWDEEGRPYMQAMHAFFGAGGIVAPLVIEPFLSEKIMENVTNGNSTELVTVYGETNIHSAFLISLAVIITCALPFFYMYFRICCCRISHKMAAKKMDQKRPAKLPVGLKLVLCIFLSACMMSYCAVEDTFSGFLATFCVDYLQWDKSTSSYATSLHWGAFTVGRFLGIILIKIFRPVQLLCGYMICLILAFIGLFIACITMTEPAVWVFIPAAGFFMSVIFPCIFTWTEESILEVTGKISAMFLISASSGLLLNPLFVGYLMKNIAPISFLYVLTVESFLCLSLFIVIYFLVKKYIKTGPRSKTFEIVIPPPEEMTTLSVEENP